MSDDGKGRPPRPPGRPTSTDRAPIARMTPAGGTPKATPPAPGAPKTTPGAGTPRTTPGGGTPRTTPAGGAPKTTPGGGTPRTTPSGGTPRAGQRGPPSRETRAVSAARTAPAKVTGKGPEAPLPKQLLARGTNELLNLWGFLRDAYQGFRRSDAYFKYRVLVVVTWAVLSVAGMGVACPGHGGGGNPLGARLVVSWVGDQQVYMILNESDQAWEDVRLVVNDRYSAAMTRVAPGADVTLGVRKLMDQTGKPAPLDLQVDQLVVKTSEDEAVLVKGGKGAE